MHPIPEATLAGPWFAVKWFVISSESGEKELGWFSCSMGAPQLFSLRGAVKMVERLQDGSMEDLTINPDGTQSSELIRYRAEIHSVCFAKVNG